MSRTTPFLSFLIALSLAHPAYALGPLSQVSALDIEGKPVTPERIQGKITVMVMANRDSAEDGYKLGRELRVNFDKYRNFACIPVLNLKAVPTFIHDQVLTDTKIRIQLEESSLKKKLGKAASTLTIVIPDWEGKLSLALLQDSPLPAYAVFKQDPAQASRFDRARLERQQQQLGNHLHIFILDKAGEIQAHYLDSGSTASVLSTTRKLLEEIR